ncbi:MAG: pilin [Candidatus Uhrbacteria bacterium]
MRLLLTIIFFSFLLMPTITLADAATGACEAPDFLEPATEVGVFLENICSACWLQGNCSLNDFMTVVANAGNYILSIVAALVFLMYIGGGFFWIISHGDDKLVTKGKEWIKASTVGLIIVLVAYTGIVALRSAITQGTLSEGYVICSGNNDGSNTDGDTDTLPCGLNSNCYGYSCVSLCEKAGASCVTSEVANSSMYDSFQCSFDKCTDEGQYCCPPEALINPLITP